jgi:alpha-ribazole phosphatase/probable phosphoglycerate mutase
MISDREASLADLMDEEALMHTTLYLLRHAATEANLAIPPRLQGREHNPPLAKLGIRQAEATRDFLAVRPIDVCYCSPLLRAAQTAQILAAPYGLTPIPADALTECDIGRWEGQDWQSIRYFDAAAYKEFMADPATHGYPDGESFRQVHDRAAPFFEGLLGRHEGQRILVVSHRIVNRVYLSSLLGLPLVQAREVLLDNCGISVVTREDGKTSVNMLNASFHLQGVAA